MCVPGAGYGRAWGYGNYLIVDHGGGFSTLYAHCTSVAVNVGDTVTKGQTIAYVGTTGWSTGYHLHFEIRRNGAPYQSAQLSVTALCR